MSTDIVLIGGGHAHALVLRRWGMVPVPGVRLTLISPDPTAPYTGMLPGVVAGAYPLGDLEIDLVRLCRFAGARLILGRASALDREAREISVTGRPPVRYDYASLDIGITSDVPALPGFAHHGVPAKPLDQFAHGWEAALAQMVAGTLAPQIVVLGAGIAGVELALAMADRLRSRGVRTAQVTLVDRGVALAQTPKRTRNVLLSHLKRAGVKVCEGAQVTGITEGEVHVAGQAPIPSRFTVGAAGAQPHPWLAQTDLALRDGFVEVLPSLQSVSDPRIYAAGDCAHMGFAPRPKAGVFAVRQAPVLAWNLAAEVTGAARKRYHPQSNTLKLVKLAGREALADYAGLSGAGPLVWRWKDRIDRAFMRKLTDLPRPARPALPKGAARESLAHMAGRPPLCGGCGAKIGAQALRAGLGPVRPVARDDVVQGIGDDAAVLRLGGQHQVLTTDSLRPAVLDPYLMGRFSVRHALGDVWAMGARPQALLASITVPPATPDLQARLLAEAMAGIAQGAQEAGAALVGGHSSEGAEVTISLTATGLAAPSVLSVAGAQPLDALVLTGPIGTGLLLAAEMQWRARGADIAPLWAEMARLPLTEAGALASAHAATDVTGFGLLGHAQHMARASGVRLEIWPEAVPVWPGALDVATRGVRPSLFEANAQEALRVDGFDPQSPLGAVLCDPQTCGPFLVALDAQDARDVVAALGGQARVIGQVREGTGVGLIARGEGAG